jgi:hypothetical protein
MLLSNIQKEAHLRKRKQQACTKFCSAYAGVQHPVLVELLTQYLGTSLSNSRMLKAASYSAGCSYTLRVSSGAICSCNTLEVARFAACEGAADGSRTRAVHAGMAPRHRCCAPDRSSHAPHLMVRTVGWTMRT